MSMPSKFIKLQASGHMLEQQAPDTTIGDTTERSVLLVYCGQFESMDGPVTITEEQLHKMAESHNAKINKIKSEHGGVLPMKSCPPVQVDHSTSALMTVGRLIDELKVIDHVIEGKSCKSLVGKIKILGKENVEKIMDGRWTHVSIGADLNDGKINEISITPFPAAPNAALLKKSVQLAKKTLIYRGVQFDIERTSIGEIKYTIRPENLNPITNSVNKSEASTIMECHKIIDGLYQDDLLGRYRLASYKGHGYEIEVGSGVRKGLYRAQSTDPDLFDVLHTGWKSSAKEAADEFKKLIEQAIKDGHLKVFMTKLNKFKDAVESAKLMDVLVLADSKFGIAECKSEDDAKKLADILKNDFQFADVKVDQNVVTASYRLMNLSDAKDVEVLKTGNAYNVGKQSQASYQIKSGKWPDYSNELYWIEWDGKQEKNPYLYNDISSIKNDPVFRLSKGEGMDKEKLKKHLMEVEKMSAEDADKKLSEMDDESMKKMAGEVDEKEKKLAADEEEKKKLAAEGEDTEKKAQMAAAKAKIIKLSKGFKKASSDVYFAAREAMVSTRLSSLRSKGQVTPAELKKLDVKKLAKASDEALNMVFEAYEAREPVIDSSIRGSTKPVNLSELASKYKKEKIELESRLNMSLHRGPALKRLAEINEQEKKLAEVIDPAAGGETKIHIDTTPHTHYDMAYESMCKMLDEGRDKEEIKKELRRMLDEGKKSMSESVGHDEKRMKTLVEEINKLQTEFKELIPLVAAQSGITASELE